VLEHPLLLGCASLGFFLELDPELGLLGNTCAELFLFAASALFGQPGFFFGPNTRFLFRAPSLGFRLHTHAHLFGRSEPCFLVSHDTCRLNVVKLQELIRE
jgi:hypothetical protein